MNNLLINTQTLFLVKAQRLYIKNVKGEWGELLTL